MSKYSKILERVFFKTYKEGNDCVPFEREDLIRASQELDLDVPKNLGDIIYSYRYRKTDSAKINATAPESMQWVIRPKGRSKYAFELAKRSNIFPNTNLVTIKIPEATPEIISNAARSDEQALFAKVRYNRLIDIFLGLTSYSLQNHLRTTVPQIGQVEVDEVYVAVDQYGRHYVIPVEAKGHGDELGIVQTEQDLAVCADKWSEYVPVAVGVQFLADDTIAMFELIMQDGEVRVVKERHYQLVPGDQITERDRDLYSRLALGEE